MEVCVYCGGEDPEEGVTFLHTNLPHSYNLGWLHDEGLEPFIDGKHSKIVVSN